MEAWTLTSAATSMPIPGAGAEDVEQVATLAVEDVVLEPDTPLFLSFAFFALSQANYFTGQIVPEIQRLSLSRENTEGRRLLAAIAAGGTGNVIGGQQEFRVKATPSVDDV